MASCTEMMVQLISGLMVSNAGTGMVRYTETMDQP